MLHMSLGRYGDTKPSGVPLEKYKRTGFIMGCDLESDPVHNSGLAFTGRNLTLGNQIQLQYWPKKTIDLEIGEYTSHKKVCGCDGYIISSCGKNNNRYSQDRGLGVEPLIH